MRESAWKQDARCTDHLLPVVAFDTFPNLAFKSGLSSIYIKKTAAAIVCLLGVGRRPLARSAGSRFPCQDTEREPREDLAMLVSAMVLAGSAALTTGQHLSSCVRLCGSTLTSFILRCFLQ